MKQYKEEVRELLESTWLLTGPKSFEIAIEIHAIASDKNVPFVAVEALDVLLFPDKA